MGGEFFGRLADKAYESLASIWNLALFAGASWWFFYFGPTLARLTVQSIFQLVKGDAPPAWDLFSFLQYYRNETQAIEFAVTYGTGAIMAAGFTASYNLISLIEHVGGKLCFGADPAEIETSEKEQLFSKNRSRASSHEHRENSLGNGVINASDDVKSLEDEFEEMKNSI